MRTLSVFLLLAFCAAAQNEISMQPATGGLGGLTRPYQAGTVPVIRLTNSPRLDALIRAGNLYLSAPDVVALAIENNIDVEIQRYGPLLAKEVLKRAKAGGALRSVGLPVAAGPQSVSLQGVSATTAGGLALTPAAGVSSGGGIVTQLGPAIPSLDPTVIGFVNFQHSSIPQSNTVLTGTTALVQSTRSYQAQYIQNWDFGLTAQMTYSSQWVKVNSQFFNLNPYTFGFLDLQLTQNLLQGFGRAVNGRNIRVQKNNVKVSDLQFKQQVIATVSAALNLYWDLVSFDEDVRARGRELATAQQLLEDNKKLVELGSAAPIEITRAEAQVYTSQQDLVTAQTNLLQQETVLKNALTRTGVASNWLSSVRIVPTDSLRVPDLATVRPVQDLVAEALASRPELGQSALQIQSTKTGLKGTKNALLPSLDLVANLQNNALAGQINSLPIPPAQGSSQGPQPRSPSSVDAFFIGGYGTALSQLFSRNFPDYAIGVQLNIPLRNRAAQADLVHDQLVLRQQETRQKGLENLVQVDVQNALIAVQQARARYQAAVKSRVYQDQTFEGEQGKYELGASTSYFVVQAQRDLAEARSAEIAALSAYNKARTDLDKATGQTISANNIVIEEARRGRVSRQPDRVPGLDPE